MYVGWACASPLQFLLYPFPAIVWCTLLALVTDRGVTGGHVHSAQARSFANVSATKPSSGPCHVPFPIEQLRRVTYACNRVAMAAWRLHLAEPHVDFAAEPDLNDDAWVKADARSSLQLHSEVWR